MNNKTSVVVMAAGMGSRFGGLKQIEPVGPNGESILEFSIFDAKRAGFDEVVFIIRKDFEEDFKNKIGKKVEKYIDVKYVFQDMANIPSPYSVPEDRTKPWGTAHAIYCCKDAVKNAFAVINADDYYGINSFKIIHDQISKNDEICMVGYKLGNTLTENGTVARGVCEITDGCLSKITEHTALDKNSGIPLDTIVSMNMWGFSPDIFPKIEAGFDNFFKNIQNPQKDEFFLPTVVDNLINNENKKVKVLTTDEKWYGVTYKEDKDTVREAFAELVKNGVYESPLNS